jgi:hypothetical protein
MGPPMAHLFTQPPTNREIPHKRRLRKDSASAWSEIQHARQNAHIRKISQINKGKIKTRRVRVIDTLTILPDRDAPTL